MDVKSAFLNGFINKEVYVAQPPGFSYFEKPNHVYKLKKALYGLKQAPKAYYDRLKAFLIKHEYSIGMVDNILFTKKLKSHLIIVDQIYASNIIFGSTCQNLFGDFAKIMHDEFEMSMIGELNFFLGLQIKQMEDGIFFNQSKYIKEMLKKFRLEDFKPTKTPMSTKIKLTKDDEANSVDSTKYQDKEGKSVHKLPNQIETNELLDHLRPCKLVIRENVYSAIWNKDQTQTIIALMLYCVETEQRFNLAYFIIRRMYYFIDRKDKIITYGMILTRLFNHLKENITDHPFDERYVLVLRKMSSLKAKQPKKPPPRRTRNVGKSKHT
nr:copia protein [Tanacetum cinerariifolium]